MQGSSGNHIPEAVSLDKPSAARVYDALLGGYNNFAVDRALARQLLSIYPDFGLAAHANQAFLRRVVRFLSEQGIRQFLDVGLGVTAAGSVHQVAQALHPDARVVYAESDPVAVTYSQHLIGGDPHIASVRSDPSRPEEVLAHPEVTGLLDWNAPLGLLLSALSYLDDRTADRAAQIWRDALPLGGFMAISHWALDRQGSEKMRQLASTLRKTIGLRGRSCAEIVRFFGDWKLVEPGPVYGPLWRPESADDLLLDHPERALFFVGVAYKA